MIFLKMYKNIKVSTLIFVFGIFNIMLIHGLAFTENNDMANICESGSKLNLLTVDSLNFKKFKELRQNIFAGAIINCAIPGIPLTNLRNEEYKRSVLITSLTTIGVIGAWQGFNNNKLTLHLTSLGLVLSVWAYQFIDGGLSAERYNKMIANNLGIWREFCFDDRTEQKMFRHGTEFVIIVPLSFFTAFLMSSK
ncbi:MAG: hypothetical protein JNL74_17885 [Fibrobacteres bacterium]|nr:hypothetical protein [Fibrobacterota bacterium]